MGTCSSWQGDYPPMLAYYSEELRALATGMINTNPGERPSVDEASSESRVHTTPSHFSNQPCFVALNMT